MHIVCLHAMSRPFHHYPICNLRKSAYSTLFQNMHIVKLNPSSFLIWAMHETSDQSIYMYVCQGYLSKKYVCEYIFNIIIVHDIFITYIWAAKEG